MKMKIALLFWICTIGILIDIQSAVFAGDPPDQPGSATATTDKRHDEVKLTPEAIASFNIKIGTAEKEALTPTFVAPARIAFNAEAMAHVGAAVRGRVAEIKVRVGDVVRKGDELLTVESPELGQAQSDFLQKRTAVSVALVAIEPARQAYERAKALFEKNEGIALAEVQKREAELKAAEGAHQSSVAAMTAAENALHLTGMSQSAIEALIKTSEINPRYAIRAPLDGQVIEREVTLGELVSPEKEALLVLANMSTLWVLADVPEARLKEVAVGNKARIQLGSTVGDVINGKVAFVPPTLDPNTRTARVRIEVTNDGSLRPGMFVTAEIVESSSGAVASVLAIPDDAVQTIEGTTAVFVPVKGEEHTFVKKVVSTSRPIGGMVAVLSGLNEGDEVVIKGSFILKAELGKESAAHED